MSTESYTERKLNLELLRYKLKSAQVVSIEISKASRAALKLPLELSENYKCLVGVKSYADAEHSSLYYEKVNPDHLKRITVLSYGATFNTILKKMPKKTSLLILTDVETPNIHLDLLYSIWKRSSPETRPKLLLIGSNIRKLFFVNVKFVINPENILSTVLYASKLPEGPRKHSTYIKNEVVKLAKLSYEKALMMRSSSLILYLPNGKLVQDVYLDLEAYYAEKYLNDQKEKAAEVWAAPKEYKYPQLIYLSHPLKVEMLERVSGDMKNKIIVTTDEESIFIPTTNIAFVIDSGLARVKSTTSTGKDFYTVQYASKKNTLDRMGVLEMSKGGGIGHSIVPLANRSQYEQNFDYTEATYMSALLSIIQHDMSLWVANVILGRKIKNSIRKLVRMRYIEENGVESSGEPIYKVVNMPRFKISVFLSRLFELLMQEHVNVVAVAVVIASIQNYRFGVLQYPTEALVSEETKFKYFKKHFSVFSDTDPLRTTLRALSMIDLEKQLSLMRRNPVAASRRLRKISFDSSLRSVEIEHILLDILHFGKVLHLSDYKVTAHDLELILAYLPAIYSDIDSSARYNRTGSPAIYSRKVGRYEKKYILSQQMSYWIPNSLHFTQPENHQPESVIAFSLHDTKIDPKLKTSGYLRFWMSASSKESTVVEINNVSSVISVKTSPFAVPDRFIRVAKESKVEDPRGMLAAMPSLKVIEIDFLKLQSLTMFDGVDLRKQNGIDFSSNSRKKKIAEMVNSTPYPTPDLHPLPNAFETWVPEINFSSYSLMRSLYTGPSVFIGAGSLSGKQLTLFDTSQKRGVDSMHTSLVSNQMAAYPDSNGISGSQKWNDKENREILLEKSFSQYGNVIEKQLYIELGHDLEPFLYSWTKTLFTTVGWISNQVDEPKVKHSIFDLNSEWGALAMACSRLNWRYRGAYSLSADDTEMIEWFRDLEQRYGDVQLLYPQDVQKDTNEMHDMCVANLGDSIQVQLDEDDFELPKKLEPTASMLLFGISKLQRDGWFVLRVKASNMLQALGKYIDQLPYMSYRGLLRLSNATDRAGDLVFLWQKTSFGKGLMKF